MTDTFDSLLGKIDGFINSMKREFIFRVVYKGKGVEGKRVRIFKGWTLGGELYKKDVIADCKTDVFGVARDVNGNCPALFTGEITVLVGDDNEKLTGHLLTLLPSKKPQQRIASVDDGYPIPEKDEEKHDSN